MKQLFILFSMVISFSIAEAQSIGGSVAGSTTVCSSSNSGTLTLSGQTGSIVRWQSSTDGGSTWSNISNTTTTQNYSNITATTMYRAVVQQGTNPTANSGTATISVDVPSFGTINVNASVCTGSNSGTLNLTGTFTNINYWEYSTDGGSTWNIITNTNVSQNYTNLTTTTLYNANVTNGTCPAENATPATITVNPLSVSGTISGSDSVCAGSNSGTLTLNGQIGSVIRWQYSTDEGISWTNIANTSAINNYSNISQTTDYRAVVQSGNCPTDNSSSATITSIPVSDGGAISGTATVCSGSNSGTVTLNGQTGNILNWSSSTDGGTTWIPILNTATTQNYSNLTTTTMYQATVQSGSCTSANSAAATITVSPNTVGGTVSGADSTCSGSNSGTLILSGNVGSILRWQYSTDGGVSWTNIANTYATNNYSNIIQTTNYRAVVQSGTCAFANSSPATITIFPISVGGTLNSSATVCSGSNIGTLQLTGYTGNIINWEQSIDNGLTWTTIADTTDTLNYSNISAKTLYRTIVQSGSCASKKSSIATISVNAPSVGGMVTASDTVCSGSNSGTLQLSGYTGSIIRWQSSTDGGVSWTNIANTSAINNYSNITQTTDFRAVVQNGECTASNSSEAIITVFPISIGGTLAPANYTACSGINNGTILLSGQSGNVINWEYSIDGGVTWTVIPNATASQYFQNLTTTTQYRAMVQNGQCAVARSAISTISVFPATVGGKVSGNKTVCTGTNNGSLTLNGFIGSILNWEYSIDGAVTWKTISNTTAIQNYTNLAITSMYRAVLQSGSCSTENSTNATIVVSPATVSGSVLSSKSVCDSLTTGALTLSGYTGNILQWNKSIDSGKTWITILDTTDTYVYSNIKTETMYRAVVQSGACVSASSAAAAVSLALHAHASFSVTTNGATVVFTNTSISNNGSSAWNFGDNTTSPITSPAHTYTANGDYLVQLIVKDSCGSDTATEIVNITGVGINEQVYNNPNMIIYPNPFSETSVLLIMNGKQIMNYEFKMYTVYGKEVSSDVIRNSDRFVICRGDLASGIYFYKLKSSDLDNNGKAETIATGKIVIQ